MDGDHCDQEQATLHAGVRFYAALNAFLPLSARQQTISYALNGPVSVKHVIEALGVPHTEVALILANGKTVAFDHPVNSGDRLAVYPPFHTWDCPTEHILRPPLSHPLCFVLDVHLGRLAAYLRLLGFDTLYRNDYDDAELAAISSGQRRILVTRDRRLLMRKEVVFGCCLHSRDPRQQLQTILHRYDLADEIDPWRRCLRCNGPLAPVDKNDILHRLQPLTKRHFHEFHLCTDCEQIYWKGSHFGPLLAFVESIRQQSA